MWIKVTLHVEYVEEDTKYGLKISTFRCTLPLWKVEANTLKGGGTGDGMEQM